MYSFDSRIRYSECDETARLDYVALVNYLQDCSTFHTESMGLGLSYLAAHRFAWLIAAWQIKIVRRPRFLEHVTVSTWCYDMSRTLAQRCFSIVDGQGEPCVLADSIWFTYDTAAGRPCRIPDSEFAYLTDEPRLDLPKTERKLKVTGDYVEATPIVIGPQHLDTNKHVNNAQYVLMALSVLPEGFEPSRICVQYKLQTMEGETLVPRLYEEARGTVVELVDLEGETRAVVRLEA